jgi:hypothetical protein
VWRWIETANGIFDARYYNDDDDDDESAYTIVVYRTAAVGVLVFLGPWIFLDILLESAPTPTPTPTTTTTTTPLWLRLGIIIIIVLAKQHPRIGHWDHSNRGEFSV